MINETVQLFSAFAQDVENGAYEIASTLPRARVGGGILPAPATFSIFNDVDDDSVAKDLDPPKVPALVIWGDSAADAPANKMYKICKNVIIGVAYVTDVGEDAKKANYDCNYNLRGARISFGRYNALRLHRQLNGIMVHEITSIEEERVTAAVGRRKMWGFLRVRAMVGETFQ